MPDSNKLLNTYIHDAQIITQLFENPLKPVSSFIGDKEFQITATPWGVQPHLWLLEWSEQTNLNRLTEQLRIARNHDPASGALLQGSFDRQLMDHISNISHGRLIVVLLNCEQTSGHGTNHENREDIICQLVNKLSYEFGNEMLISRSEASKLILFITSEHAEEETLLLNQIHRLCKQVLPSTTYDIACAVYPADGNTIEALYSSVNLALTAAQKSTEPTLYYAQLRKNEYRLQQLAKDMPAAISSNQITPYFQPIIDSTSGNIKSFEALVRWIHPDLGYIIPPDIIQVAQGLGLLHMLTAHIMQQTMKQMAKWPDFVQFAVNVTPSQLTDELVDLVRETVRSANIDPGRFEIEVTEDALIQDFEFSAQIFARLRAIGVAIAMDDFGAGYTSIGNLRKLEFTKIKIDKSISDGLPHDNKSVAIVKSLMFMARELDVEITVEGIEEQDQLEFLRAFNCGVQGYVFARPMPAIDMPEMMKFISPKHQKTKQTIVGIGPKKKRIITR
ncbi:MAG: EAL domain-containing protein [Rhizobiaceae bacterium]